MMIYFRHRLLPFAKDKEHFALAAMLRGGHFTEENAILASEN